MDSQMDSRTLRHVLQVFNRSYNVGEFRKELARIVDDLAIGGPVMLMDYGKPRAVLLDVDYYQHLLEQAEAGSSPEGVETEK